MSRDIKHDDTHSVRRMKRVRTCSGKETPADQLFLPIGLQLRAKTNMESIIMRYEHVLLKYIVFNDTNLEIYYLFTPQCRVARFLCTEDTTLSSSSCHLSNCGTSVSCLSNLLKGSFGLE